MSIAGTIIGDDTSPLVTKRELLQGPWALSGHGLFAGAIKSASYDRLVPIVFSWGHGSTAKVHPYGEIQLPTKRRRNCR